MEKKKTKKKIYLYLARRDKKGIKILSIFSGNDCMATRLNDIKSLSLPNALEVDMYNKIFENRMLWEPWIESADNYNKLKEQLKKRGYSNVPVNCSSIDGIIPKDNTKKIELNPKINSIKTMIR